MEPKFQSSFIPKRPIGEAQPLSAPVANIFSVMATVIFVLTLVICGALFAYKYLLTNQVAQAETDLGAAEAAYQPGTIQEIIAAESRIKAASALLSKHIAASQMLDLLSGLTVRSIRWGGFSFIGKTDTPTATVSAEVKTYASLAEQSRVISENPAFYNVQFYDFGLSQNGSVTFKMNVDINPSVVSYKKMIETSQP